MTSSKYLRYAIQAFLIIFAVFLVIVGEPLSATFRNASRVSSAVPILLLTFETWIWHWQLIQRWGWFPVPDLRGTWKGTLVSNYERPDGSKVPPIETYMVIRQSLLNISVRQFTAESSSHLLSGGICVEKDGAKHVNGIFLNTPLMSVRDRSPMAHGAFVYRISNHRAKRMAGHYWTDRKTGGDAEFSERVTAVCNNFEEGRKLFSALAGVLVAEAQVPETVNEDGTQETQTIT